MKNNLSFESQLAKFGIGLFETIKVLDKPINLDMHLDRIYKSIEDLNINFLYKREHIKLEIIKYIKINNIVNKALRITIYDNGYNISVRNIIYTKQDYEIGIKITKSPIIRGDSLIHRHKTTNYFENIYSKNFANKLGFDDALFLNTNNEILECSISNIFFIKGKKVFTPSINMPILNGTIRKTIIDICIKNSIEIEEIKLNISQINKFDFAFVTNSIIGMMKISCIDDVKFNFSNELFNEILGYLI